MYIFVEWYGMVWCELNNHPCFQSIHSAKYSSYSIHPFLQIILVQNSLSKMFSKEFESFPSPSSSDDLCLLFCIYPSSMNISLGLRPVAKVVFDRNSLRDF